jgi:hypothetical protein
MKKGGRQLTITANPDALVRRDILSDDVKRVLPEMLFLCDANARNNFLHHIDWMAYEEIKHKWPDLRPPGTDKKQ